MNACSYSNLSVHFGVKTDALHTQHTFHIPSFLLSIVVNSKVNITIGIEPYLCTMQHTLGIEYCGTFITIGISTPTIPRYDPLVQCTLKYITECIINKCAWTMGLGVKTISIPGSYGVCITKDTECICHDGAVDVKLKCIWMRSSISGI